MMSSNNKCVSNNINLIFKVREYDSKQYNLFNKYIIIPEEIYIKDKNKTLIFANSVRKIILNKENNDSYKDIKYIINIPTSCKNFDNSTLIIDGVYLENKDGIKNKLNLGKYRVKYRKEIYFFFFGV